MNRGHHCTSQASRGSSERPETKPPSAQPEAISFSLRPAARFRPCRCGAVLRLGEQFLAQARHILEAVDALGEMARPEAGEFAGRIRVTGPTTLGVKRLARIVARFSDRHPSLSMELSLSDRSVDLASEGFDLAVRIGELGSASLIARRMDGYRFAVCASPAHLARHGTPRAPDKLVDSRCVLNLNLIPRNRWPFLDARGAPFTAEAQKHTCRCRNLVGGGNQTHVLWRRCRCQACAHASRA